MHYIILCNFIKYMRYRLKVVSSVSSVINQSALIMSYEKTGSNTMHSKLIILEYLQNLQVTSKVMFMVMSKVMSKSYQGHVKPRFISTLTLLIIYKLSRSLNCT